MLRTNNQMSEDKSACDRWENEGGRMLTVQKIMNKNNSYGFYGTGDHKLTLLPPFEHKEPEDDDCGLPERPIYSNYVKYLWKSHTRSGGIQIVPGVSRQRSIRRPQ
jgi:hypothetical protein